MVVGAEVGAAQAAKPRSIRTIMTENNFIILLDISISPSKICKK
jgi:hypothetical protein